MPSDNQLPAFSWSSPRRPCRLIRHKLNSYFRQSTTTELNHGIGRGLWLPTFICKFEFAAKLSKALDLYTRMCDREPLGRNGDRSYLPGP